MKIKKLISIILMLTAILLPSCAVKKQPIDPRIVDLSAIWDKPEKILLSSIATDIEYIPLETSKECLLADPDNLRVTITENYIAVNSGGLKLFDRNGHFLRGIGSRGKGPLEYISGSRYVINEKGERIYILDADTKRVLTYGLDGKYLGVFQVGPEAIDVILDESGRIGVFYLSENPDPAYAARVEWFTEEGSLVKTIPVYAGRPRGAGWVIAANCYQTDNELLFNENPFDTTYCLVDDRSWVPRWIMQVGPGRFPPEISIDVSRFSQELDNYIMARPGAETARYLFITTNAIGKSGLVVYDKKDRTARYMLQELMGNYGLNLITNDLDGGSPLKLSLQRGEEQGDTYYSNLVSPIELLNSLKEHQEPTVQVTRPDLREKLQGFATRLREEDNPVVMVVTMKTEKDW